jgi:hypothetical protein
MDPGLRIGLTGWCVAVRGRGAGLVAPVFSAEAMRLAFARVGVDADGLYGLLNAPSSLLCQWARTGSLGGVSDAQRLSLGTCSPEEFPS